MQQNVPRLELLKILKDNKTRHNQELDEAKQGFLEMSIEAMEKNLAQAKSGGKVQLNINLNPPVGHLEVYDDAIGLLEMSNDETVVLDTDDYRNYVKDEWHWSPTFKNTRIYYATKGVGISNE